MEDYWPHIIYAFAAFWSVRLLLVLMKHHEHATHQRLRAEYERRLQQEAEEAARQAEEAKAA